MKKTRIRHTPALGGGVQPSLRAFRAELGSVHIMFYFGQIPIDPRSADLEQLQWVLKSQEHLGPSTAAAVLFAGRLVLSALLLASR